MAKPEVTCISSFCFFFFVIKVSTLIFVDILWLFLTKTIIPLGLVGYEMILPTRRYARRWLFTIRNFSFFFFLTSFNKALIKLSMFNNKTTTSYRSGLF